MHDALAWVAEIVLTVVVIFAALGFLNWIDRRFGDRAYRITGAIIVIVCLALAFGQEVWH